MLNFARVLPVVCFLFGFSLPGQNLSNFVTRNIAGTFPKGDGGPATSALLETPQAVAIDASGSMFIADAGNGVIRKVTSGGVISSIPTFNAYAYDIKLDSTGNLYVAANNRVYKVTQAGAVTTVAGNGNYGYSGDGAVATAATFNSVYSIALDSANNLYVCDYANQRVRKVDAKTGIVQTIAGSNGRGFAGDGGQATAALLNYPRYIALDGAGNLYISDSNNYRIRKVGSDGTITSVAGNGTVCCTSPDGGLATSVFLEVGPLAVDGTGNVYFFEYLTGRVRMVSSGGIISAFAGNGKEGFVDGSAGTAQFSGVNGIAMDSSSNVYIVESNNDRVRVVSGGTVSTVAGRAHYGGDGGPGTAALLHRPRGVAVAVDGTVFFTDTINHRVRKVATDGTISTIAGTGDPGFSGDNGPSTAAMLSYPDRIAIDAAGNVYVVDQSDFRVRKITPSGTITTVAGNGNCCFSNDSAGAVNSPFFYITGIAVDGPGNLYLSELSNYKIKKVTPAGGLSTYAGNGSFGFSGDSGAATGAQFRYPTDLALDSAGNLYINDQNRVRKVDKLGVITTIAGNGNCCYSGTYTGPATAALIYPYGMAADSNGGLYLTDYIGVNYVASDGTITRVGGGFGVGYAGDDAPTTASANTLFLNPGGVAVAAAGDVIIADTGNSRIRKLQPNDPVKMDIVSGNSQAGTTGTALKALIVKVTGRATFPVPNAKVTYQVTSGSATLSAASTTTDATGQAGIGATPTAAGSLTITASVGSLTATFTATVTDPVVVPQPEVPVISAGGIGQNGFSVPPVQTISPGAITTIYGSKFAAAGTAAATNSVTGGKLSTNFGGACVTFGGVQAPIFGLTPNQITVEVPNVAPGTVAVQVLRNCGTSTEQKSNVRNVTAQAASPEFLYFQANGDGKDPVAAVAANGDYIGVPGSIPGVTLRQAVAGDILVIYALGLGATTPAQTIGVPAAGIGQAAQTVSVTIGGVKLAASDVLYAGVSPSFIGLYQINLRVPATVPSGNQTIVVQVGSNSSPSGAYLAMK
jgi:trimeric autotransporter adhesin